MQTARKMEFEMVRPQHDHDRFFLANNQSGNGNNGIPSKQAICVGEGASVSKQDGIR
jgi:hypothetical protein